MKVAIVTSNPVKVDAANQAFAEAFALDPPMVEEVTLHLALPEQPMGDEIASGAMARAVAALEHSNADFGLGIEAGLMQIPGTSRRVSVQVCAIVDTHGRSSIGMGPGYELPEGILEAVLAGESLRDAFERLLQQSDPARRGAIYYLSNGWIDRTELTIQGIRMALIPWLSGRTENGY